MDLDEADRALLHALRADARLSYRELARLTGVSTPTAASKVRKLEALGVIRGYAARIDPHALGRTLHVVELHAAPAHARSLAQRIGAIPHVEEVLEMAGGLLHARLAIPPGAPLQEFLQAITALEGVQTYRIHLVMTGLQGEPDVADVPREVHVACHECKGPVHGQGIHKRWDEDGGQDHWFCCRNCTASFEARLLKRAQDARSASAPKPPVSGPPPARSASARGAEAPSGPPRRPGTRHPQRPGS